MVKAKLIDNMADKLVEKKYHRGREIESYNRLSINSTDKYYHSNPILQIFSEFLHSFRPVDLTAGPAGVLSLQPSINFIGGNYGR
ncbi:MAG: hypothetical protein QGF80_05540 [Pelagibacteraceae bacterium]|jgi:hypothetical protein|nr:hypothetical protein [Candidatus Paceibacterota bacterium]MDP6681184.1 hypothetical protein [Pelagibacteraceae bacterium]|tara:strand:+ start:29 stop:283 length:255 start_codon:yes stop_codon:yes gene_type:complete